MERNPFVGLMLVALLVLLTGVNVPAVHAAGTISVSGSVDAMMLTDYSGDDTELRVYFGSDFSAEPIPWESCSADETCVRRAVIDTTDAFPGWDQACLTDAAVSADGQFTKLDWNDSCFAATEPTRTGTVSGTPQSMVLTVYSREPATLRIYVGGVPQDSALGGTSCGDNCWERTVNVPLLFPGVREFCILNSKMSESGDFKPVTWPDKTARESCFFTDSLTRSATVAGSRTNMVFRVWSMDTPVLKDEYGLPIAARWVSCGSSLCWTATVTSYAQNAICADQTVLTGGAGFIPTVWNPQSCVSFGYRTFVPFMARQ